MTVVIRGSTLLTASRLLATSFTESDQEFIPTTSGLTSLNTPQTPRYPFLRQAIKDRDIIKACPSERGCNIRDLSAGTLFGPLEPSRRRYEQYLQLALQGVYRQACSLRSLSPCLFFSSMTHPSHLAALSRQNQNLSTQRHLPQSP